MSRRKQSKPRALKLLNVFCEWESEPPEEAEGEDGEEDMYVKNDDQGANSSTIDMKDDDTELEELEDQAGTYHCESCGCSFNSLDHFMDHRNYDCISEVNSGVDQNWQGSEEQSLSASGSTTPTDLDLNYTIGVTESTPYACQFCNKAFPRLSYLKRHEQLHSDQMPFKCEYCQRLFKHKRSRDRHVKLHTGDKKYRCSHCESAFSRSDHLKIHLKTHDNAKPYQCTVCNRGYNTSSALTSHMQSHKKEIPSTQIFKCMQCTDTFQTSQKLQNHILTHQSPSPKDKSLQCMFCPQSFVDNYNFNSHLEQVHNSEKHNRCPVCSESFSAPDSFFQHIKEHNDIALPDGEFQSKEGVFYICPFCAKDEFVTLEALELHVCVIHPNEFSSSKIEQSLSITPKPPPMPYNCEYCTMTLDTVENLQKHTLAVHSYSEILSKANDNCTVCCSQCTMGFSNGIALTEHIQTVHEIKVPVINQNDKDIDSHINGDSSHLPENSASSTPELQSCTDDKFSDTLLCNQCGAAFSDFESFRTHLKSHLDAAIRKLPCSECDCEFTSEDQLDSHIVTHFLATTTEYGCQSCLKLFSKPDELQKHLMDIHAHHLYRCALCKEMFDSKVGIQVHFAVKHSNECKLYKCIACSCVFRSEMEWQLHVKVTHLQKAKPYRCLFCNDSFTTELELQCHLTTHKKQFPCPLCEEAFHVEYLLDKHMQTKHCSEDNTCTESSEGSTNKTVISSSLLPVIPKSKTKINSISQISKTGNKCDICDAEFNTEAALLQHRTKTHNIKGHNSTKASQSNVSMYCAYCNETFKSRSELDNHMKSHIQGSGKHKCNICDEICPTSTILAEHKLQHCKVVKANSCLVCKIALKSEDQFFVHSQQHNTQGLPMQCVVCRQTLIVEVELQMHAKFHFKNCDPLYLCIVCQKQYEANNVIPNSGSNGTQNYICKTCYHGPSKLRCSECKVKFETMAELKKHILIHKKTYQCIKCQQSFDTENEIQIHVATHVLQEGTNHECKLCHQIFDSPGKLQCHLIEHTFEGCTSFQCYICSTVFTTAVGIQSHMLEHGLNSRPYDCLQCHQKFFFRAELENHTYNHSLPITDGEYQCHECFRIFSSIINLTNHRKIHEMKNSTFKCSLCPEVFNTSVDMQQHYFKNHSDSELEEGKKCFRCMECDKEFPCMSNLQGHMRIHTHGTKYTCTECNKEFALSRNLNIHMRSHNGEKPYECPVCKKCFARKENRKAHLKSHSGIKPFMCPHCGKTFSRKCHVKDHMRIHLVSTSHTCDVCHESFSFGKALQKHMEDHGHVLECTCKICCETFISSQSLKKHMIQTHHVEDIHDNNSLSPPSTDDVSENGDWRESSEESLFEGLQSPDHVNGNMEPDGEVTDNISTPE